MVFDNLSKMAVGLLVAVVAVVLTFLLIGQVKTQIGTQEGIDTANTTQCQTSAACNATVQTTTAVNQLPTWFTLIVLIGIIIIIISLVRGIKR